MERSRRFWVRSYRQVVEAIDAEKREVGEEATRRIREIEASRDLDLNRLERARRALVDSEIALGKTGSAITNPSSAPKRRRRRKRPSTSAESVAGRREAVFRQIGEQAGPVASGELARALDMSPHSVQFAVRQLLKERRIVRLGSSSNTRYDIRAGLSTEAAGALERQGTLQGRIVMTIKDRGYASPEELGQAIGEPVDRVLEVCAALQAEEEIRMNRHGGRAVYVLPPTA